MSKKHKHYDLITAWANGAEIEYSSDGKNWCSSTSPTWNENTKYRIKPLPKSWEPKGGDHVIILDIYDQDIYRRPSDRIASQAKQDISKYARLLAYRDEFDPGYRFTPHIMNWYVYLCHTNIMWSTSYDALCEDLGKVYMSKEVAKELANKLNSGEVVL